MAWRRGQTYSQDLRDRVLAADDESAREVAERLDVSVSYVVKARQRRDRSGRITAGPESFARRPMLADYHDAISQRVREQSDGTLEDLRAWLARSGVSVSLGTMWNTVRRLGLTLKKRPLKRVSVRARTLPRHANSGPSCKPSSISAGSSSSTRPG
jgi:transposase